MRAAVGSVLQVCGYMRCSPWRRRWRRSCWARRGDLLLYIADMPSGLAAAAQTGAPWALAGARGGVWRPVHRGRRTWPCFANWACAGGTISPRAALSPPSARSRCNCAFPAPAAEAAMARLETGALETSTLAAMLLLVPALLAVACDGHACAREKSNS